MEPINSTRCFRRAIAGLSQRERTGMGLVDNTPRVQRTIRAAPLKTLTAILGTLSPEIRGNASKKAKSPPPAQLQVKYCQAVTVSGAFGCGDLMLTCLQDWGISRIVALTSGPGSVTSPGLAGCQKPPPPAPSGPRGSPKGTGTCFLFPTMYNSPDSRGLRGRAAGPWLGNPMS